MHAVECDMIESKEIKHQQQQQHHLYVLMLSTVTYDVRNLPFFRFLRFHASLSSQGKVMHAVVRFLYDLNKETIGKWVCYNTNM
jgi:hypothetical protein